MRVGTAIVGIVGDRLDADTQRKFDALRALIGPERLGRYLGSSPTLARRLENNGTASGAAITRLTPKIAAIYTKEIGR